MLQLPYAGFPITQLQFMVPETLFQRNVILSEAVEDDSTTEPETTHGKPMRVLGSATWTRVRADGPTTFTLMLAQTPKSNHLVLETSNGDNAAIHPADVQAYYRAPRLLFRSSPSAEPVFLYYGQPEVSAPQYDLNLIAAELLSTPPLEAKLGSEEALKASRWWEPPVLESGHMKQVFWGVMLLVVLGLLVVIAKLLPEEK